MIYKFTPKFFSQKASSKYPQIDIRHGSSRLVLIFFQIAIKIPHPRRYIDFLAGLRANYFEVQTYKFAKKGVFPIERLCPILFALPFGIMVIMKKAKILTSEDFGLFDYSEFCNLGHYRLPVEKKADSFGFLENRIVAVDYG